MAEAASWCDAVMALVLGLGGVALVRVEEDAVHLRIASSVPITADAAGGAPLTSIAECKAWSQLQGNFVIADWCILLLPTAIKQQ